MHGLRKHPLYNTWNNMMFRCYNSKTNQWHRYGGRGIKVCKRWHKLENFIADVSPRPIGKTLDRKNNDKGYSPSNCRWATKDEQESNKSKNVFITHAGKTLTLGQWARHLGISRNTIKKRYRSGWPLQRIVSTPVDLNYSLHRRGK